MNFFTLLQLFFGVSMFFPRLEEASCNIYQSIWNIKSEPKVGLPEKCGIVLEWQTQVIKPVITKQRQIRNVSLQN